MVFGLRSRGGQTKIVIDQRQGAERRIVLRLNGYMGILWHTNRVMSRLGKQWTESGRGFVFPGGISPQDTLHFAGILGEGVLLPERLDSEHGSCGEQFDTA
jgi:hypothetical protein